MEPMGKVIRSMRVRGTLEPTSELISSYFDYLQLLTLSIGPCLVMSQLEKFIDIRTWA